MTTSTSTRPAPTTHPDPARRRGGFFGLSATQLVATAFAAITATVAGSYLGVSGTVIGAALASVVTAIGNAVYGTTIRSTRDRVLAVVPATRRSATDPADDSRPPTRPLPGVAAAPPALPSPSPRPQRVRVERETPWRGIAIGSIAVFAAVILLVTGVEIIAGRPLADVVRGDGGSGTSLFGGTTKQTPATPTPTVTVTVTPSIKVVIPTVTTTGSAATVTVTPTATATATATSPTPTATGSASASPTVSPSPSQSAPTLP